MENITVVSIPEDYAISNGAICFPVSLVLYAANVGWMQAQFPWIVLSVSLYIIILDVQRKQVNYWKEHEILV